MPEIGPKNFNEFANYATRTLHDALLREGSKGMKASLYLLLPEFVQWVEDQKKLNTKAKELHENN